MLLMTYVQVTAMVQNLYFAIANNQGNNALQPALTNLTIYSGTIPTVNKSFVWNPANYESQALFTYNTITPVAITGGAGQSTVGFRITALANRVATGTGTATWYALHNGVANTNNINGPAMFGSVTSNPAAADTLLLSTTNLVAGNTFDIMDFTVRFLG